MTGLELMEQLKGLLMDPLDEIWSKDLKEGFINEAMGTIVLLRPDATAKVAEHTLVADTPRQSIPEDGNRFLYLVRNIDGRAITEIDRKGLGKTVPSWATIRGGAVEYYMFEEETPREFWVFPVPERAFRVELVYSRPHTPFREENETIGLPEIFTAPIIEYALYRCLSMNGAGQNAQKSSFHLNNFYSAMGKKTESDVLLAQTQER